MLYVFHGTDIGKSQEKARTLINSLRAKKPDAAFVHITANDWNPRVVEEHLGGQGLFSNKYIVFLDRLNENSEAKEKVPDFIPAIHESANIFILLEGKLLADFKKIIEKNAEKIVVSDLAAVSPFAKKDFNIFALADAVGSRDSIKAWTIYRQALENGIEAEAISGTLFWQIKSMLLAAPAKSASESGLNPFIFSKSKKYASNYSAMELTDLAAKVIALYHDGHRGLNDLELSLERLVLNIGSNGKRRVDSATGVFL
jgi:DNA polymerase III delta subunit